MRDKLSVKFKTLSISIKIMLYYFLVLILSISVGAIVYRQINSNIVTSKLTQISMDSVSSDSSNFDSLIHSISNQSKMLISSQVLQSTLENNHATFIMQAQLNLYLNNFINFNDEINSIYIFDNYGNEYYVDNNTYKSTSFQAIKAAPWYDDVMDLQGGYILQPNAGGVFEGTAGNEFISVIRVINDISSQTPLGLLIVNISTDTMKNALNSNGSSSRKIMMLDESDKIILSTGILNEHKFIDTINQSINRSEIKEFNGEAYIISSLVNKHNWKIVSINKFNEIIKQSDIYNITIIITLLVNGMLFIIGMAATSLMVSKPIHKLVKSMKLIPSGEFKEVSIKSAHGEIYQLQNNYNIMIRKIQELLHNIVLEQKNKRKMELDVLQSEIKPHFLYNSLDAISSSCLSGQPEKVYALVKALGCFYRYSLNNGEEYISIKDELKIADNYLIIQNIRCGDMFTVNRHYDEKIFPYKIPRLILQPLIENAFKHGIKGLRNGIIRIEAYLEGERIILSVEDNGVGMSQEQVNSLLDGSAAGLGLKATIGRLKIYYNDNNVFNIESKLGSGTKISLSIPINIKPGI